MTASVLLVDDHVLVRSGLRVLLEQLPGVEVVGEAGTGREALAVAAEVRPDLVILDIEMPELNGLDTIEFLKRDHPQTRVLVLSMHQNPEHVQRALANGADAYIVKAAAQAELALAVRAALRGESYLSPAVTRGALSDRGERARPNARLTPRQREILQLVVEGHSTKSIARILGLSVKTVEAHRSHLMTRLGIRNLPGLVRYAMRVGMIPSE